MISGQGAGASTETIMASVHVMSTRSPTCTLLSASLSATFELYVQPFGPFNVIDGIFMSMRQWSP